MVKIKILVCCHKKTYVPNDNIYLPIQVGRASSNIDLGFQGDNEGENISEKNCSFCELTAVYWAWKNLKDIDYIGLCHYRRFFDFSFRPFIQKEAKHITEAQLKANIQCLKPDKDIEDFDVVLPTSLPYKTNIFEHHAINLNFMDLSVMEEVILKLYPDYRKSLEYVFYHKQDMPQRNMFVMKKEIFDQYCAFLFDILFEVEKHIKLSPYSYYRRVYGFMGEMLLPLFCYHNSLRIKRRRILFIDERGFNTSCLFDLTKSLISKMCFVFNGLTNKPIYSVWKRNLLKQEFPELFQ
ncbi:DUF4422 domain-containing protein [Bacteroides oleiciplenus]|uniref:DUF4422 domain-containing protein n=1 Tax=Bacteroides oleiciplenus TaxID=626931 RepID=UPI0026DB52B1|nr:DUF4422 domain-containing protein [Bacteroides oleiciplenus]